MDLTSCASNITRSEPSNALGLKTHFCMATNISWFERAELFGFCVFSDFGEISWKFPKHGFSIEHSEATVRDIHSNPCALDSSRSEVSDAQRFVPLRCIPSPLVCKFGSMVCNIFFRSGGMDEMVPNIYVDATKHFDRVCFESLHCKAGTFPR